MIQTYSGRLVDPMNLRPEDVFIQDVAHALSLLCRWTGHCRFHYSVAQHSVLGSQVISQGNALWFLLHDAAEAYLNDMSRQTKDLLPAYKEAEDRALRVIVDRFQLPWPMPAEVKFVDNQMLMAEKDQVMERCEWPPEFCVGPSADVRIDERPPREVERAFMERFISLRGGHR